ncbi:four-helix bundle copper-binding protein [Paenibacillus sp. PastF-1]
MMKECIRLDRECADLCELTAKSLAASADYVHELCRLCAEACERCGNECSRHEAEHCRACAEACYACAEACRIMAAA